MSTYYYFWFFLAALCFTSCAPTPSNSSAKLLPTKFVGGIQINEADQQAWAQSIKNVGMNMAQVTAYAKQGNWDGNDLWWEDSDTSHVINEIRAIKSQGVHVMMVLRVALQHNRPKNKFKWHGMIYPMPGQQMEEWFYRYNYFVEMWAKICEREGVDILAIGSELNALAATVPIDSLPEILSFFSDEERQRNHLSRVFKHSQHLSEDHLWVRGFENYTSEADFIKDKIFEQKRWADQVCFAGSVDSIAEINKHRKYLDRTWRSMIDNARKYYQGTLTLAANFDNYQEVNFWDELDCMGINAYFPLRKFSQQPYEERMVYQELTEGWETIFDQINSFKEQQSIIDKPIFFTEIGYTPKADCTIRPWQGDGFSLISNNELDTVIVWKNAKDRPQERVYAMQALKEVVEKKSIPLIGLSYWKMTTHYYHQGYEPFMLLLDEERPDALQLALREFLE